MRLKEKYQKEIVPALKKELSVKNSMLVPRVTKVTLNVGFGRHYKEKDYIADVEKGLHEMTGQKPVMNKAKKSISAFKIREGQVIGAKVTLRGNRMYDFIEKLVNITFPRVRDFRGITTTGIDENGNMTVGFKEHVSFPEIKVEEINNIFGLEVSLTTNTKNRESGLMLFQKLGFPFKKEDK
ncbi:MAG: 50S ribosomal protein L5 [Patescibacteria group bacterium]|jgi:large subunit ribosomal protein L5|nr:50S ribosomal protein L5 [Patescibacteria group bacterium]